MKIRKNLSEAFQVKNNKKGNKQVAFTKAIFKGSDFKVIVRGRNKNRRKAVEKVGLTYSAKFKQDIPIRLADRLAVYIVNKKTGQHLKYFKILYNGILH